jgi:TPR repeat protein
MIDRNRTRRSRTIAGAIRLAALAAVLATAACTQVKEIAGEASAKIDQWFGTGSDQASAVQTDAGSRYQDGLDARARGAEADAFASVLAAAELGHGAAAYELGLAYRDGRGIAEDLEASAQWINRAADRGEPRAQHLIGLAYYSGTGVARDYTHAVKFLTLSAGQGHAEAQYIYGVVHATGLGLPNNSVRGCAWLLLATRAGYAKAREVAAALERKMTPARLAKATARADKFKPAASPLFADPPTVMYA